MAIPHREIWPDIYFSCAACLLQFTVIYEFGRYTALTDESIFQGLMRLNRKLGLLLWILMTLSFLWFGAFAAAGGTWLAALTDFPAGWTRKDQALFWAYLSMTLFLAAILLSRVIYRSIELFMSIVALVSLLDCFGPARTMKPWSLCRFLPKVYPCRSSRCRGHGFRLTQPSY